MKRLMVSLSLGLMFLVIGAYTSYAEETCGCMGMMGEGMHERGMHMMEGKHRAAGFIGAEHRIWERLKDLGLDDGQKEAIREIRIRTEKDTVKKRADLKVAGIELRDILHKDPADMKAAEAKLKQMESLRTDLHLSHIKAFEEVKAKLTPDQRKKLTANLGRHKRWEGRGKGFPRHEEDRG